MVRTQVDVRSGVIKCAKIQIGTSEAQTNRPEIQVGAGDPTHSANKGTLYIKIDAAGTTDRLWINTDGATTWGYFTASA